jgi:peptide/nickel transport system ATP-binding protein
MLDIKNYSLKLKDSDGRLLPVLEEVSLHLGKGQCLGIVGESGSGKSVLAMSSIGLLSGALVKERCGEVLFNGQDLGKASPRELRKILGKQIGVIFQEPMTAMNPLMTLAQQLEETVKAHLPRTSPADLRKSAMAALAKAGFSEPERFYNSYPHQLSGGMRQRAMIAMALVLNPMLLIADEPTTAIDAELQVHVIDELTKCKNQGQSILFISHDLGVMRSIADTLAVMYCGCLLEYGDTKTIFDSPRHPYTQALIAALPRLVTQKLLPKPIPKTMPAPHQKPAGCVFADRCPRAFEACTAARPKLKPINPKQLVACELYNEPT